jgi:hypothetical protein
MNPEDQAETQLHRPKPGREPLVCACSASQRGVAARPGRIGVLVDALRIMSRALEAAHAYEMLRAASGRSLARRGLTRSDVPRTVYRVLTGGG